ncbi:MAG TPA: TonB-dependent receptor [Bacteroidales bacterium]|nr:TonB-dependent receptor [Bacteroidales bacterium]
MRRLAVLLLINFLIISLYAQYKSFVAGKITDAVSGQPLVGATVVIDSARGAVSDAAGYFIIVTFPGRHTLDVNYIGYQSKRIVTNLLPDDTTFLNIDLDTKIQMLDEIVVSAGKYEQKISDVIVSMDIIKSDRITETSTTSLESLINQSPGIDVLDGQPRIRGGSGYSYGAGSRVLVLVDELPILSPDASDVKWEYLPIENISQIEIIKGASSVLYGSSALNGIINIRTAYPKDKPATNLTLFNGLYLNPKRKELIWWDNQPLFSGASVSHSRKAGNLDIVFGGHGFSDGGYRENEWERRLRFNVNLLYRDRKVAGLSYGMNTNAMFLDKIDFFLWQDADSGAYRQNTSATPELRGFRLNIDPYMEYYNEKGSKHTLKARYFRVVNKFEEDRDKDNDAALCYSEYKYHKSFNKPVDLTLGASASFSDIHSQLYENHSSLNGAVYSQLDGEIQDKLKLSLGVRFETYRLDDYVEFSKPIFRTGINFHLAKYTFLRASYGQGYRFPSIAEKYTATSLSSVHIFPNPELNSETGWSMEFGIKQGLQVKSWIGFLDVSLFQSTYKDMIEFTFGTYADSGTIPTFDDVGFKALNVGNAQITGFEITFSGEGNVFNMPAVIQAGYTYIYPVDLDYDPSDTSNPLDNNILKYRYQHSVKADFELNRKKLSTGLLLIYNSFMKNIDEVFTDPLVGNLILPGYPDYRQHHQRGYIVFDHRISYQLTTHSKIAVITKNLFNKEYIGRPGDIRPPRNITLQLSVSF